MTAVAGAIIVALAVTLQRSSEDLAEGASRDLVVAQCTACHSSEIIVASHMSRKAWDTTLTWMVETQGMTPLEPSLRKAILDYLETTQGLAQNEDSGEKSPWASPRYRPNPIW